MVLDKHHSWRIELVRHQYSGSVHGVIAGIGLVTCVYINPETDHFWLLDYRLFVLNEDGKTKLDHVAGMLHQLAPRGIFTARCSWTDGNSPRPCLSGCSPPTKPSIAC